MLARELHVVCVGDAPYSPDEVAAALDVPISPNLAWDPRAARLLAAGARLDHWLRRSALLRSARTLLSELEPSREAARA